MRLNEIKVSKERFLPIEKAVELHTARLLPYYRAIRKSYFQDQASYYPSSDEDQAFLEDYLEQLKIELDSRENIE